MDHMIRVGPERIIAMRYVMKNATDEVLVNTLEQEPVSFMFGSGEILPGLEGPLKGLKIGEEKSFSLSPDSTPGLDQTFYFRVIIDDVRWANEGSASEEHSGKKNDNDCGPDCAC